MIVTVTPNPSLDLLFAAERLVWDDANRVPSPRRRPGGQGINVVRAIRAVRPGADAVGVAALGGPVGREIEGLLDAEGTPVRVVPVAGQTRTFVGARESATGRSLLLNPRGPTGDDDLARALLAAAAVLLDAAGRGSDVWVGGCGSLLPGLPADFYYELGGLARQHGARFVPDCDGEALREAVPVAHLLVPNELEAGRLVGRPVRSPGDAAAAGRALLERGPDRVVITLGSGGAVSVGAEGACRADLDLPDDLSARMAAGSAVGAGDAFLAALLSGPAGSGRDGLARAVATGSAVLLSEGSDLVRAEDVARILPHVRVQALPD